MVVLKDKYVHSLYDNWYVWTVQRLEPGQLTDTPQSFSVQYTTTEKLPTARQEVVSREKRSDLTAVKAVLCGQGTMGTLLHVPHFSCRNISNDNLTVRVEDKWRNHQSQYDSAFGDNDVCVKFAM